jgi:hypothetical protein
MARVMTWMLFLGESSFRDGRFPELFFAMNTVSAAADRYITR